MIRLQTPYLLTLDTPLVIFNNRLLQPKARTDDNDNYAEFYSTKFALEEIVTPKKLEDLFFRHNYDTVQRYQEEFSKSFCDHEFQSKEALAENLRQNRVLSLIVEKILPILTADRLEGRIEDIINEDKPVEEAYEGIPQQEVEIPREVMQEVRKLQNRLIRDVENEYQQYRLEGVSNTESQVNDQIAAILQPTLRRKASFPWLHENSVLEELLQGNNLMIIDDKTYFLETIPEFIFYFEKGLSDTLYAAIDRFSNTKSPESIVQYLEENKQHVDHKYFSRIINKIEGSKLKIHGEYFLPILDGKINDLRRRYKKLIEKSIKIDAIEHNEYQTRMLYELSQEKRRLERLAQQSDFERNGAGFHKGGGSSYVVYIKTPPYALKSPHVSGANRYVPFDPAKIGVKIKQVGDGNRSGFEITKPFIMHSYRHPFLSDASSGKEICLGDWGTPGGLSPEQKVLTYLNQGKKTLMMGYRSGSNPYIKLHKEKWSNWISRQEVERRGLVVLNDFGG